MKLRYLASALIVAGIWLGITIAPSYVALHGLIAGCIYALIALGFTLIYRTVRFFHFAHGAVYIAGAYLAYTLTKSLHYHPILSFITSILLVIVIGVLIDRLVYFRLRRNKASSLILLIASFGVFILIQNLLQLLYGAHTLALRAATIKEGHHMLGTVITNTQLMICTASGSLLLILWAYIRRSRLGKAIRAVSDDPIAASAMGINVERIILVSFAIGSALAGVAGILISLETDIEPTMGLNAILKGIIASIIGGIGNIPGAMFGGLFLGFTENLGIWKIQAGWKDCIAFIILIIFLLLRPHGIFGMKTKKEWL